MKTGFTHKKCLRCGGNILLDKDSEGWYEQCLQCSRTWYLETVIEVHKEPIKVASDKPGERLS